MTHFEFHEFLVLFFWKFSKILFSCSRKLQKRPIGQINRILMNTLDIENVPKYPLQFESHPIIHSEPWESPIGGAGVGFCHAWVVNHHFSTYGAGVVYAGVPHRSESEPDWPLDPFLLFFFLSNLSDHLCVRHVWHFTFGFVHCYRFPWHYRNKSLERAH